MTIILAVILLSAIVAAQSKSESSIEYSFAPAEMEEPDVRAMADHLRPSINLKCEFVKFDATALVDLIENIEDSDLSVGETSISVRFFDGDWLTYVGLTSEVGRSQSRPGPYVWEGAADLNNSFATFVTQPEARTTAYISKSGVMFQLSPSSWSEDYFLCMRDPEFPGQRID
jgi:hypothetical protein